MGIDWGGTYIKAGIVNSKGKIIKKIIYSSQKLKIKQAFISKIKSLVDDFARFKIKAVGIGAPGIIDIKKGFIYYLPNISGWRNYPLKDVLKRTLRLPVFIDNDANVFALAEARLGAAKGRKHAIFLTLGTGLGGAVIFEGKVLESRTSATELGHVPVSLEERPCGCGGRGCIETFTGAKHLIKRYRELKRGKGVIREVKELFEIAQKGEKEALAVWREFSQALGRFLAGMINIFNPEVIVLGGGVSGAFSIFKPLLWEEIKQQAMWPQIKGLKLVRAKLKDAGIIGAALLAKESLSL